MNFKQILNYFIWTICIIIIIAGYALTVILLALKYIKNDSSVTVADICSTMAVCGVYAIIGVVFRERIDDEQEKQMQIKKMQQ